jgi:hypothetical protein
MLSLLHTSVAEPEPPELFFQCTVINNIAFIFGFFYSAPCGRQKTIGENIQAQLKIGGIGCRQRVKFKGRNRNRGKNFGTGT